MRKKMNVQAKEPSYCVITDIAFAQVDAWFGHVRRDLKMDLIYPEDPENIYPCIIWISGGGWQSINKSVYLAYLSDLARQGFVVASMEYRTSNEERYPTQLQDIKAGIRYLRAHAQRYHIDRQRFGVMGDSAGGHLACMAALVKDRKLDVGDYLEYSSEVQAACPWYPLTDFYGFPYESVEACSTFPGSLLIGKNLLRNKQDALELSPISFVTKEAPPFFIIHGNNDHSIPFAQSELLHDKLEEKGCDVTLLELEGAGHVDLPFFQREVWAEIATFFKMKL